VKKGNVKASDISPVKLLAFTSVRDTGNTKNHLLEHPWTQTDTQT